jgi:hypothetical protein
MGGECDSQTPGEKRMLEGAPPVIQIHIPGKQIQSLKYFKKFGKDSSLLLNPVDTNCFLKAVKCCL